MGVWASWDRGAHWSSLRGDLPVSSRCATSRSIRATTISLLATHGRGLYVLDDITPLQEIRPALGADVTLFDLRPAVRWNFSNRDGNLGYRAWAGENPPYGAMVAYVLKDSAKAVTLTVSDASGAVIRTIKKLPNQAGLNRTTWDLRFDPPEGGVERPRPDAPPPLKGPWRVYDRDVTLESFGTPPAPMVNAGRYTLTLDVDGRKLTKPVTVELDPRYDLPPADVAGAGADRADASRPGRARERGPRQYERPAGAAQGTETAARFRHKPVSRRGRWRWHSWTARSRSSRTSGTPP